MKNETIRVYFIPVDEESGKVFRGSFRVIENSLSTLQSLVNFGRPHGSIRVVELHGIDAIVHNDGKPLGFPMSRLWVDEDGKALDYLAGNIICCRSNKEGEFVSIEDSDLEIIQKYLVPAVKLNDKEMMLLPTEIWLPTQDEFGEQSKILSKTMCELQFPEGARLRLLEDISDPYTPKKAGDIFVSSGIVDDEFQLSGRWESGGSLALRIKEDKFEKLC